MFLNCNKTQYTQMRKLPGTREGQTSQVLSGLTNTKQKGGRRVSCFKIVYLLIALCMPVSGYGENNMDNAHLFALIQQQQQQIEALRQLVAEQQVLVSQRLDSTEHNVKKVSNSFNKVSISKKGLKIKSANGDFSFHAGGRIHADYANYNDDKTAMGNGAILRRARIYFNGRFFRDWLYKAELDFSKVGRVGPRNVWLGYRGWKPVSFKLGNFQEPFSLEEMNSSNDITFMERSLANTFAPSYHMGIGANMRGDFWSLSTGLFGESLSSKNDNVDNGWGVATRVTVAPILAENKILHIGFSNEYRKTDTDNIIRIRSNPESRVTNRRLVDTRTITGVDHSWLFNGELAAVYGSISLQGEYIHSRLVRSQGDSLNFQGAYLQGSWFLTGESRPYNAKRGVFKRVTPLHHFGAWELALRYSMLDLNDKTINGGEEDNVTLGLNWYANYSVRFMLNYIFVNAHPNRDGIAENPDILQMRGQLAF